MALNAGSIEIKLFASIAKLQSDMDKASKHIDSFSKRTEATIQRTGNAFKGLFAGITINTIARLADEYKKFDSQLKLATNTVEDYNKAYANVIRIGRTSMSDIGAIGVLYARLTNNLREYGTTQEEVSDITESVSLALRVSNATVQETNSVMLQLSQSFGSGRINGQEFLAVMEGAPMLMRQLAKSIGIPFGELKKLSEQGKLTADLLKKAWTDPVFLDLLRTQVKEVGTISSAYTVFVNNLKQFIGEADKASGASRTITQAITLLADNLNTLATGALVYAIAKTGQFVAGIYASLVATRLQAKEALVNGALQASASKMAADAEAAATNRKLGLEALKKIADQNALARKQAIIVAEGQQAVAQAKTAQSTLQAISLSRQEVIAKNQVAIAEQNRNIRTLEAIKNTAILSGTIREQRIAEANLLAAQKARSVAMAELAILGKQQAAVTGQLTAANIALASSEKALAFSKVQTTFAYANNAAAVTKMSYELRQAQATQVALTTATSIGARAMGAFRTAIMFLGGPIGATITILGTLAFAFASFGKKSAGEMEELLRITKELNEELSKTPEKIIAKSASSLDNLAKVRDQLEKDLSRAQRGTIDFSTGQIFIDEQEIKRIQGLLDASLIRYQELTNARIDGENKVKQAVDESANATKALRDLNISFLKEQIEQQEKIIELAKKSDRSEQEKLVIIADAQKKINDLTGATKALKEEESAASKAAKEAAKAMVDYYERTNESIVKQIELKQKVNKDLAERIETMQKEVDEYGKLESAIEATALARLIERKEMLARSGATEEELELLDKEIKLRNEIVGLAMSKERLDAEKKSADESAKAWEKAEEDKRKEFEKTVDNIDRIFAEGFAGMINGGKSSWKSFTQSMITTFKTTVINEIYKLLLRPFVVNIIASVAGITGAGGAVAGDGAGAGGGVGGIFNTISEGIRSLNTNVVNSIQNLGTFIQDIPGLRDAAGFISTNATTIAKGLAYTDALVSLLKGDVKGAAFSAAGAAIGNAIAPGVGGAIGAFLGKTVGGLFGGSDQPPRTVTQLPQVSEQFNNSVMALMQGFGQDGKVKSSTRFTGREGGSGYGFLDAKINGTNLIDKIRYKDAYGEKSLQQFIDRTLGETLVKAIQRLDLPQGVKDLFKGLKKPEEVNALIGAVINLNQAADGLNKRFGLTVDEAAKVAKEFGFAGEQLAQFVNEFAALGGSFNTVGKTILSIKDALTEAYGSALPASLKDFDAALKSIDTTTKEGIATFAEFFALRGQFEQYQAAIDGLRGSVRASIFSMVSDQEKLAMQQEDLAKIFGELGYEIPGSVLELVNLGKSIDFTTESGLNLAAVFPTLVSVFMETQDTVNGLVSSLSALDSSRFRTLFEFTRANAYAASGTPLSSLPSYASGTSFVPSDGPAMIHRGERILTAEENRRYESNDTIAFEIRALREENMNMRAELRSIAISSKDTSRTLDRLQRGGFIISDVDLDGNPQVLKVEVV